MEGTIYGKITISGKFIQWALDSFERFVGMEVVRVVQFLKKESIDTPPPPFKI